MSNPLATGSLSGVRALVTGSSRGVGADTTQFLAEAGARVVVNYRNKEKRALQLVAKIEAAGGSALSIGADLTDPASVAEMIGTVQREFGGLDLLVRQERHADGLGIASGWLTAHAAIGATVDLRLLPNPSFAPLPDGRPCIYIGNGSGLAGLRSHLRARVHAGRRANWLLFGERESAYDRLCRNEIAQWQSLGFLERIDLVFSRDPPVRTYVQDRLRDAADDLRAWIDRGACVFVCGSLHGMSAGVDAALRDILGAEALDDLIAAGNYRRDVY